MKVNDRVRVVGEEYTGTVRVIYTDGEPLNIDVELDANCETVKRLEFLIGSRFVPFNESELEVI